MIKTRNLISIDFRKIKQVNIVVAVKVVAILQKHGIKLHLLVDVTKSFPIDGLQKGRYGFTQFQELYFLYSTWSK